MKPSLLFSFALVSSILAACDDVIVPASGDTSPHGGTTSAASTTSTGTSGGTSGQGGGADAGPSSGCPAQLAPPADCGDFAEACAGAHPLAGGGDMTFARDVAVDGTFVYWFAADSGLGVCGGVIYRTPRAGGPSTRFADAPTQHSFEADDAALYVVEGKSVRAFDTSTGTATDLGPIDPGNTDPDTYAVRYDLARTPGGMVAFGKGQWTPSFFHVDTAGVNPIATNVGSNGNLGSVPSFDGTSLFFSWMPHPWAGMSSLFRGEAGSTAMTELAAGAAVRDWPSVVASDGEVFFVTGDPMVSFGMVDHPMGISRVAKTGTAPTVLVPPSNVKIDQLLVGATDLYFSVSALLPGGPPYSIQAVPRTGGAVSTVWSSTTHPDSLRQDSGALYFALAVSKNKGELSGTGTGGLIVRVEKIDTAQ